MNNNTKLFGVLVAALFAFGAFGASAQTGFSQFVELGDWEYDIGNSNVHDYCTLQSTCSIYTTDGNGDSTKGDLYLGPETTTEVEEGFIRLFNTHGFDVGTLVQDEDADEGATIKNATGASVKGGSAYLGYIETVAGDNKLQSAELAAFFISNNTSTAKVAEDDVSFAENERIDDDHESIGATLATPSWKILFADLDGGGSSDHDANEPLFADVDGSGDITVGDLIMSGDDFFSLVQLGDPYLVNPGLIAINGTEALGSDEYFLAILDEQDDYNDNGYRGEPILLVRNASGEGFSEPRVGEFSYVLTGDRQGELIKDGHPFHEEVFASIVPGQIPPGEDQADSNSNDAVVICALVDDADDDPVDFDATPFLHFDDTSCSGNDADEGDVDLKANSVISADADGELDSFISTDDTDGIHNQTTPSATTKLNFTNWYILDLDHDDEVDNGEPIVLNADGSMDSGDATLTTLDLVFTTDGAFLAGPGYQSMSPVETSLTHSKDAPTSSDHIQLCTYYEEEEDDNGNDVWVAYAVHLRSHHFAQTSQEGPCGPSGTTSGVEEDVLASDFVLAGDRNIGQFLTDAQASDEYEGEYSSETGAGQLDYDVWYDDLFPSGFGPEDVVFLMPAGKPKLDESAFYLGGPAVSEDDDYYFTDDDDLVKFSPGKPFVLIEGDNRGGLSENDWLYVASNSGGTIDDETMVLYKGGSLVGEEPEEPETPEEPEEPEVPEEPETPETPEEPDKKQPGFEALALVAALGAALVLVRRRN